MNELKAMKIAGQTMIVLKKGKYMLPEGEVVQISKEVDNSVEKTKLYNPDELEGILISAEPVHAYETLVEVTTETTLEASVRLLEEGYSGVTCLNFANARNPGGGFLIGSLAQEESIARSSGLFPTISQMKEMYKANKKGKSSLYTDYMIFSPEVPVFRLDDGTFLKEPNLISVITSPAVHAGNVRLFERKNIEQIEPVMKQRILKILALAKEQKQEALVLGAFGCGIFKNDVEMVARLFKEALEDRRFKGQFKKVIFAIYESKPEKPQLNTFSKTFK